jgi:hypothetical protein
MIVVPIMVAFINECRRDGAAPRTAVRQGAATARSDDRIAARTSSVIQLKLMN